MPLVPTLVPGAKLVLLSLVSQRAFSLLTAFLEDAAAIHPRWNHENKTTRTARNGNAHILRMDIPGRVKFERISIDEKNGEIEIITAIRMNNELEVAKSTKKSFLIPFHFDIDQAEAVLVNGVVLTLTIPMRQAGSVST